MAVCSERFGEDEGDHPRIEEERRGGMCGGEGRDDDRCFTVGGGGA